MLLINNRHRSGLLIDKFEHTHYINLTLLLVVTNTRIYNLSSGPYITRFLAVVAKERKDFE